MGADINESITDSQLFIAGDNRSPEPPWGRSKPWRWPPRRGQFFAAGAGSNGGIFQAAQEVGFMSYGVDFDECPEAAGSIVDNNLKLVDNVVEQLIDGVLAGTAEPLTSFGLLEGGTGAMAIGDDLASSECLVADYPEIVTQVQEGRGPNHGRKVPSSLIR